MDKDFKNMDIFLEDYGEVSISSNKLYVRKFGQLYKTFIYQENFDFDKLFNFFVEKYGISDKEIILKTTKYYKKKKRKKYTKAALIELEKRFWLEITNGKLKFFYDTIDKEKIIENLIAQAPFSPKKVKHKKRFYMAVNSHFTESGLELKKFKVKDINVSISEYYNDDFFEVDREIKGFLNDDKRNGIILLHGKYGTGKSTYIRHLMRTINKRFIFFPMHLVSDMGTPRIINFLTENPDSVLIIEDCEDLIKPRKLNGNNEGLANILNLGDGLLSDALGYKLICTFNTNLQNIDPALLRQGRLFARYEFKPLSKAKVQKIAEKLGLKIEVKGDMTLAEIFNQNQISVEEEKSTFGFGNKN